MNKKIIIYAFWYTLFITWYVRNWLLNCFLKLEGFARKTVNHIMSLALVTLLVLPTFWLFFFVDTFFSMSFPYWFFFVMESDIFLFLFSNASLNHNWEYSLYSKLGFSETIYFWTNSHLRLKCIFLGIENETSIKVYKSFLIGLNKRYGPYAHFGYWSL